MKCLVLKEDGYAKVPPTSYVLTDISPFLDYVDLDRPEPTGEQVLIEVSLAPVNPSDEMFIQGLYGEPRVRGNVAGFEGTGVVVSTGDDERATKLLGKRVSFTSIGLGSWSEFALTHWRSCIVLGDEISDTDAASLIVNPLTALAMYEMAKSSGSSFIVSAGSSQLCKMMISCASRDGVSSIALVRRDDYIEPLLSLGATHVLNVTSDDFAVRFGEASKSLSPRFFFDAVCDQTSADIFARMGADSRWVIYGKLSEQFATFPQAGSFIFQQKRIEGFWLTRWLFSQEPSDYAKITKRVEDNFVSGFWGTDVGARLPLSDVSRLPEELSKKSGKVFFEPSAG